MLQDTSNRRQKQLQSYLASLSQLESMALQLEADKEKALAAHNHRRSEYTDVRKGLDKSIESAVKERVAAETYIERVEAEVAGLRGQQELLALEKAELMQTIEREASDQMLAINKELQCLESSSRSLLDPQSSANASRNAYMQLLSQTTAIENTNLNRANERIAGLKARLYSNTDEAERVIEALKGKVLSLAEENHSINEAIQILSMEKLAGIEVVSIRKKKRGEQEEAIRRANRERESATVRIAGITEKHSKMQAEIRQIRMKYDQNVEKCEQIEWKGKKLEEEMGNLDAAWAVLDRYHQNVLIPCLDRTILAVFELNQRLSTPRIRQKPREIAISSPETVNLVRISPSDTDCSSYLKVLAEKTATRSDLLQECVALQSKTEAKTQALAQIRSLYAERAQVREGFRRKVVGVCIGVFTLALLVL
jgi:hypothetical protein